MINNPYYQLDQHKFRTLCEILENHPKSYQHFIKKDIELMAWISKVVPQLSDPYYTLNTKIFWIINGLTDFPVCEECQNQIKRNVAVLKLGYKSRKGSYFCSHSCAVSSAKTLSYRRTTCIDKYGVDSFTKTEEFAEKFEQTSMDRYGVKNAGGSKQALEKQIQTNLERRGVPYTWMSEEVKAKGRETTFKNYGTYNNMQSEKGKQEYQEAMLDKYGVDHNWKIPEKRVEMVQHSKDKYGENNYNNRKKSVQTCIDTYGVRNPTQVPEIRRKQLHCWYEIDGEKFNSSWELAYWIFQRDHGIAIEHEPISLDYFDCNGANHKYFPDFRINGSQLVEIKGNDQFDKKTGKMIDKLDESRNYIAEAKYKCMIDNNVLILKHDDIKPYIQYVKIKYGKNYLKSCKIAKS